MTKSPIEALEERFDTFIGLKNPDRFFVGLEQYFQFIEDTFPFNNIAHSIFSSSSRPITLSKTNDLYQKIIFGQSNNASISPISIGGSGIRYFHRELISGAKKVGVVGGKTVILNIKEAKICSSNGSRQQCYALKKTGTQRFKIILMLFKRETAISAGAIADRLSKDGKNKIVQDGIKKEIVAINRVFKEKTELLENIIASSKLKGKNMYFLNREAFSFQLEK